MALLADPVLLIIDELSLGLAPKIVEELLDLVRDINATGISVVLVEQSVNLALTVADRAYFMEKGEVRFEGPTAELLERGDIVRSVFLEGAVSGGPATTVPRQDPALKDANADVVLETTGLNVRFGGIQAVRDVSLSVRAGEVLGLIGPNGAGKTTTFNACTGLLRPTHGQVTLGGVDITASSTQHRAHLGLGRTVQRMELFESVTVAENIALGREALLSGRNPLRHIWTSRAEARAVAEATADAIDLCGLAELADRPASGLSTGQRRLVELARVIAGGFQLLLLDEPSSGLDVRETERFGEILQTLVRDRAVGILLVEHDMNLVMNVCEHLFVIDFGRPIFEGGPAETQASDIVRAAYLGEEVAA
jgi:ABC-type branched-subunit amino acid transport system ATPase component